MREGGLVAFPTETVYGLGANALDAEAVARIYDAKGRPARNPVIVHVVSVAQAKGLVTEWPDAAEKLAQAFWPGPLTLILKKKPLIPDIVTAGGSTVAIRMPDHPVARALIEAAGAPIAAPSANRSEQLSSTTAEHVLKGLSGRVDLILDGGPTPGGLESTVVDVTTKPPVIRRPGLLSQEDLSEVTPVTAAATVDVGALLSPGTMTRHYAPRIPLIVVSSLSEGLNANYAYLVYGEGFPEESDRMIVLPADSKGYAAGLYHALHRLEESGAEKIIVLCPPSGEGWDAVQDRLKRASA